MRFKIFKYVRLGTRARDALTMALQDKPLSVAMLAPFEQVAAYMRNEAVAVTGGLPMLLGALWNPWFACVVLMAALATIAFVLSEWYREYSMVDRYWSIQPVAMVLLVAAAAPAFHPRLLVMAVLVTMWGSRLTYNYAIKGGYVLYKGEDYRWEYVRAMIAPNSEPLWTFFNLTFVCIVQTVLLGMISALPAYEALLHLDTPFGWKDVLVSIAWLMLFTGEVVADWQMWHFQRAKRALSKKEARKTKGFYDQGLYRFSRHPNYFCEVGMWVVFSLFGLVASGEWWSSSCLGCVLLALLFNRSTDLTERISASKYPAYAEYQRTTNMFFPWFPKDYK
ncbi:Uncharacterized protein FVE85_8339 [Porphyridium purpureum]|uniref:Steroid 5-alpha reductase C-terminal domain-containing protein n=1 Tax=Porphyridium purpureum TaxID=35688 RepID=A0A5J4YN54_PORPP|nr:Uncharacterized protein FVE85_8339 [Porphyridium purpureum]|eukprot:POR5310..scf244_11